jgi:hypothetical protein
MNTSESVVIVAIILSITVLVLAKRKPDDTIREGRQVLTRPVIVICGDCMTDAHMPVRTELGEDGRCIACGGASWILVSDYYATRRKPYRELELPLPQYHQPGSIVDIRERNRKARGL